MRTLRDFVNKYALREKQDKRLNKDGLSGYKQAKDVIDGLEEGPEEDKLEDEIVDMTKEKKLKKSQTDIWGGNGKKIAGAKERKASHFVDTEWGPDPKTYFKDLGLSEVKKVIKEAGWMGPPEEVTSPKEELSTDILTPQQLNQAKQKVRNHYRLSRQVTDEEVMGEIENLARKGRENWDDWAMALGSALQTGAHPIDFKALGLMEEAKRLVEAGTKN